MSDPFVDPGEPGEPKSDYLKPGDLLNLPCLFRVTGEGWYAAKPAVMDPDGSILEKAKKANKYLECDVVVLGASGIEAHDAGVRIGWSRVVDEQISLADKGRWMPARPKKQDDNSIILLGFNAEGKEAAARLLPEAEALFGPTTPEDNRAGYSDAPFGDSEDF